VDWISGFLIRVKGCNSHRRKRSCKPRGSFPSYRRRLLCEPLEDRRLLAGNSASLVSQLVAANTVELPGAFFSQTWTIKNTGTTTWSSGSSGYTLNLVGSDSLGVTSPSADGVSGYYHPVALINGGGTVAPGATATFTMSCIAPEATGTYTDTFQMSPASGSNFGPDVTVQIVVSQAGPAGAYDRARAVSYANNYAGLVVSDGYFWTDGSTETDYGAGTPVPTNDIGDDCAHFVSCCIGDQPNQPGGGLNIPSRTASYGEPGADRLVETVLLGGGLATQVTSLSSLLPGDVIGWMWNPSDGTIDHDTIYLGNGQVAAHSDSCLAVSATTWYQSSYPDLTQYLIHINSTATRYISVSGNLAFGNVTAGSSAQTTLTIYNGGNSALNVSSISLPSGFSGNWSGTIPSAGSQTVTVTFAPTAGTTYGGTVTVNSNDTAGTATMTASGTGLKITTTAAVVRSGGTPIYGNAVTFTATITPASGSGETGTVQFEIDGSNAGSPVALSGNTATYTTSALGAGSHTVVAVYTGNGEFSGSTSSTLNQSVGMATLTITADNAGKTYGTLATLGGTAFTQTGLVTANGDSITGVSENCAGCAAAAAAGSYAIVPSAATGTGLGNYTINYVNGSLAVAQAANLAVTTGKLTVLSAGDLADGCNITVGSFAASPITPAASAAAPPTASTPSGDAGVDASAVVFPDPKRTSIASYAAPPVPAAFIGENAIDAAMFGFNDQQYNKAFATAAFDAVLAEYARRA
jgi:hypothetical protein